MSDLLHNQEPPAPRESDWQAALHPRLLQRLLRPLVQPSVVSLAQGRAMLARMLRMAGDLPLLARMLQHLGGEGGGVGDVPIVHAQPVQPTGVAAGTTGPISVLPAPLPIVHARHIERHGDQSGSDGKPTSLPTPAPAVRPVVIVPRAPSAAAPTPAVAEQGAAARPEAHPVAPPVKPTPERTQVERVVLPAARHRLAGSMPRRATRATQNGPRTSGTETSSKATRAEQGQPQSERVTVAPAAPPISAPETLQLTRQPLPNPAVSPAGAMTSPGGNPAAPAPTVPVVAPVTSPVHPDTLEPPGRSALAHPVVRPLSPRLTADVTHPVVYSGTPVRATTPGSQLGMQREHTPRLLQYTARPVVTVGQPARRPASPMPLLRSAAAPEPKPGPTWHDHHPMADAALPAMPTAASSTGSVPLVTSPHPADAGQVVPTVVGAPPTPAVDLEELVEKTLRRLRRQITIESERLGERRWR